MPNRPLKTAASAHTATEESRPAAPEALPSPEGNGRDIRRRTPYFISALASRDSYRKAVRVLALATIDFVGIWAAIWSALAVKAAFQGGFDSGEAFSLSADYIPFVYLITVLIFARGGHYGAREGRPGLAGVIVALFQVAVISLIFALIDGNEFSSYWLFFGGFFFACVYVGSLRYAYEGIAGRLLTRMGFRCRAALVGTSNRVPAVARALEDDNHARRYQAVGYFSVDGARVDNGVRHLGDVSALRDQATEHAIEEVIIADPEFPQEKTVELIDDCQSLGIRVRVAPSTMEVLIHHAELVPGEGLPLFELKPPVFEGVDFVVKRTFDFIGAALLLLVCSPVLLVTALAVRMTSRGPILHRSLRPGIGGRPFDCLKFRTMSPDAEDRQSEFEALNEKTGAIFKIREDPRLTRVGRFLRRNSIDELPQLWNVLRGDMSLVGPRPLPLRDHVRLEDWHRRRYLVLPGITGLWQVSGRSNLDFDDMVRLDFLYLERWSVLLDLVILLKTIPAVIRRRGAY